MDGERVMRGNILIVRHLPSSLDASEKENLLKHFGAVSVKCMANYGRLVSCQPSPTCPLFCYVCGLQSQTF